LWIAEDFWQMQQKLDEGLLLQDLLPMSKLSHAIARAIAWALTRTFAAATSKSWTLAEVPGC